MTRAYLITSTLLISLTGCFSPFTRFQSAEDAEREKDLAIRTIGDVTEVENVAPQQVSGVGLVTGLDGTGDSPQGNYRKMLEAQLRQQKVDNIKALLDSPDNALVLVTGMLPAGLRKGERIDLEITLPPGSRTTSLRGGYLHDCPLRNYETVNKLKPDLNSNKLLQGHVLAKAKGSLMVGLGNPDEATELRRARIWEGAVALSDQPFYLHMKNDDKSARVANAVAERLNLQFRDPLKKKYQDLQDLDDVTQQLNRNFEGQTLGKGDVAKAINKERIIVRIPFAYRLHPERYLLVSRLVPMREDAKLQANYRSRLNKMLLDPQETIRAALRLEALGQESVSALEKGLLSSHPLVRFAAAESLTYLGRSAGVEELARLMEPEKNQPLRFYGLLALANLDESLCRTKLMELLGNPDVELRAGAFAALRLLDQGDTNRLEVSRLPGEFLNDAFWLHHVAPKSAPLIHVSLAKRAEITLFGDNVNLVTPISIQAGPEFIISAAVNDDCCTVSRIRAHTGIRRHQCKLKVSEVIQAMADLGAQYPDVVEFLRKADERRCLACPLRINAFPEQIPLETLAKGGFE